ncbi:MAG: peroxidase-related enzyme [Sphingomonadales bacterium]|nr:peroxidase-related enzyme [Sphingomonadales bacterium]
MSFFSRLPGDAGVRHAMALNKPAGRALVQLHTAVMRQPSQLSAGERELIAAYVSGLNACRYCHGVHSVTAETFGVDPALLTRMIDDLERSGLGDKWLSLMAYVRKLTLSSSRLVAADAQAVLAAGWDEQALHDAIAVVCLFNFMNRFADGHGIKGESSVFVARGKALMEGGYDPLLETLAD